MSGLPPIPAAPERKQPRLLLGRSVPNRKSSGVRKAPGPARSGWNSRSRPRTPIQPPPGPGSSAPPAPECTYASYTNPQHRQRVFWAGSSNSNTLPTRSVRNVSPNPTERESLGGSRIVVCIARLAGGARNVANSALSHGRALAPFRPEVRPPPPRVPDRARPGGPLLCSTPTRTGSRAVFTPTRGGGNARAAGS